MRSGRFMTLDRSGNFEIRVHGIVDEHWSDYLGGAVIKREEPPSVSVSVLRGQFQDQAALMGILNTLYDLGFPVLSFSSDPYVTTAPAATIASSDPAAGVG